MKSLKELIDIKNNRSLNESFKSSILTNIVKSTDNFIPLNDLNRVMNFILNKKTHFKVISELLTIEVADVFRKYLNMNNRNFEDYKNDILKIFSPENINKKEDEFFDKISKEISLNSIKNKFAKESDLSICDFKFYKKNIINAFSKKFNDREIYDFDDDYNSKRKRYHVTFELAEFSDDLFDKHSMKEIEDVKSSLSPVIATNLNDEVIGITSGHDVLFFIDPYTLLKPGESCAASLFKSAVDYSNYRDGQFPLKIHIEFPDKDEDSKKYDDAVSEFSNIVKNEILESTTFFKGNRYKYDDFPDDEIMKATIADVDNFLSGENKYLSSGSEFTKINGIYYRMPYKQIFYSFLEHLDPLSNYPKRCCKVINPFNFTTCVDIKYEESANSFSKYKDYIKKLKTYGIGNLYVLNKNLYKEKKNKETGILEPVNSQYLNFKKYTNRNEWKKYLENNKNVALNNIKRYNEIIRNNMIKNANIHILKELSEMMRETKDIQNLSFKINNIIFGKIYDIIDLTMQEPKAKNNYKRLNTLYSATNDPENSDKYSYNYIERDTYSRKNLALDKKHNYAEDIVNYTLEKLNTAQKFFTGIQNTIIDYLVEVVKISKNEVKNNEYFKSKYRSLTEKCNLTYLQSNLKSYLLTIIDMWKATNENVKSICFNNDENAYNDFITLLENLKDQVFSFASKYEINNIVKSLKNSQHYVDTLNKMKQEEYTRLSS